MFHLVGDVQLAISTSQEDFIYRTDSHFHAEFSKQDGGSCDQSRDVNVLAGHCACRPLCLQVQLNVKAPQCISLVRKMIKI